MNARDTRQNPVEGISVARQLAILSEMFTAADGKPYSQTVISRRTGISQQTLDKLIRGKTANPRLDTLIPLCRFYRISLDYFGFETETECRHYLAVRQIENGAETLHTITQESQTLSEKGKRNVIAIMQWMKLAGRKKGSEP